MKTLSNLNSIAIVLLCFLGSLTETSSYESWWTWRFRFSAASEAQTCGFLFAMHKYGRELCINVSQKHFKIIKMIGIQWDNTYTILFSFSFVVIYDLFILKPWTCGL